MEKKVNMLQTPDGDVDAMEINTVNLTLKCTSGSDRLHHPTVYPKNTLCSV